MDDREPEYALARSDRRASRDARCTNGRGFQGKNELPLRDSRIKFHRILQIRRRGRTDFRRDQNYPCHDHKEPLKNFRMNARFADSCGEVTMACFGRLPSGSYGYAFQAYKRRRMTNSLRQRCSIDTHVERRLHSWAASYSLNRSTSFGVSAMLALINTDWAHPNAPALLVPMQSRLGRTDRRVTHSRSGRWLRCTSDRRRICHGLPPEYGASTVAQPPSRGCLG